MYSMSSPMTSVLLRCGDGDGEGREGGARVGGGGPRLESPALEVGGTAGESEAEEVGRFWKYCSPGSSSSKPPHGYTWRRHSIERRTQIITDPCACSVSLLLLVVILSY